MYSLFCSNSLQSYNSWTGCLTRNWRAPDLTLTISTEKLQVTILTKTFLSCEKHTFTSLDLVMGLANTSSSRYQEKMQFMAENKKGYDVVKAKKKEKEREERLRLAETGEQPMGTIEKTKKRFATMWTQGMHFILLGLTCRCQRP